MRWRERISFVPAVLWGTIFLALQGSQWMLCVGFGVAAFVALWGKRGSLDIIGQIIVSLALAAVVYLFSFVLFPAPESVYPLKTVSQSIALWCLGITAYRLYLHNALGKEVGSAMLLMTTFLLLGVGVDVGEYIWLVSIGTFLTLWAVKCKQWFRTRKFQLRVVGQSALVFVPAAAISAFFIYSIPIAYRWLESAYIDNYSISSTGFSPVLELGSVGRMLQKRDVALRVFTTSKRVRHLRGAAYNTYSSRYWTMSITGRKTTYHRPVFEKGNKWVTVIPASSSQRYFLPLGARDLRSEKKLKRDGLGIGYSAINDDVGKYAFVVPSIADARIMAPVAEDLVVPKKIRGPIETFAQSAVQDARDEQKKIDRLVAALRANNQYSLTFERTKNRDSIVDFLYTHKSGHCEYFASAFALLARTVGIPTRVIGGYYLSEYSGLGKYYIVREKHAHAWVEAWVNGRWQTVDATPPGPITSTMSGGVQAWDSIAVFAFKLKEYLLTLDKRLIGMAVVLLFLLWAVVRFFQRAKRKLASLPILVYVRPHEMFLSLQESLQEIVPQKKNESIESWAARLDDTDERQQGAKELLLEYATWRYGNQGSIEQLHSRFLQWKKM